MLVLLVLPPHNHYPPPMATLIPSLGVARFDARGELRLAERLKDSLEDNAWGWHNIPVGPFGQYAKYFEIETEGI